MSARLLPGGDDLLESPLAVETADHAAIEAPVVALHASESLEADTLAGIDYGTATEQTVVNAQRALLIGAEDKAGAKLIVEVTHGQLHVLEFALDPDVGQTPSLEVLVGSGGKARHRPLGELKAGTSIHVLTLERSVGVGVCQEVFVVVLGGADAVVLLGSDHHVALHGAVHRYLCLCLSAGSETAHEEQSAHSCEMQGV